ncbi:MAG TPA: winged helix-turn-helix domain-containing protein [Solirubrobacterales bacterium]|jgi:predicted ArsR family transcriptional regulator|nr:winged helix-turn-helix domain-containing protein [Solirubrobacterales bacterium]
MIRTKENANCSERIDYAPLLARKSFDLSGGRRVVAKSRVRAPTLLNQKLVAALKDPTRAHILNLLTQKIATAGELADEVGVRPQHAHYHLTELKKLDCVEVAHEEKRGSLTTHYYRATVRHYFDTQSWTAIPEDERWGLTMSVLARVSSDLDESIRAETVHADDRHLSRTIMDLDQTGWIEVVVLLESTLEGLLDIRARAATRLAKSGEIPRSTKVSLIHFETPDDQHPAGGSP